MEDRNTPKLCPDCGARGKREFVVPVGIQAFRPDWYWVDSNECLHIESKKQLFDECRKRGKFSVGYGQECELTEDQLKKLEQKPGLPGEFIGEESECLPK